MTMFPSPSSSQDTVAIDCIASLEQQNQQENLLQEQEVDPKFENFNFDPHQTFNSNNGGTRQLTPELIIRAEREVNEKDSWRIRDIEALRDMILGMIFILILKLKLTFFVVINYQMNLHSTVPWMIGFCYDFFVLVVLIMMELFSCCSTIIVFH